MSIEPEHTLTRRRLLRNGAAGSVLLAAGPLLTTTPARAAVARIAGAPKKGGTLTFARSVAPTQLDPANSIIAGDVYTLDKIFEPLYITSPARPARRRGSPAATRSSADDLTWTFHLRPGVKFSDGTPLTADRRRLLDQARGGQQGRPAQLPRLRDQERSRPTATNTVVFTLERSRGRRSCRTSRCSPTRSCRPTSAARARRRSSRARSAPARSLLPSFTPDSNLTLKANPHYWQTGKPYLDSVADQLRRRRQPAGAAAPGRPGADHRLGPAGERRLAEERLERRA